MSFENAGRRTMSFASAICIGRDWSAVAGRLGTELAGAEGRLGILYTAEPFASHLEDMTAALRERTGVPDWVSAAGYGVIASGEEHYGESGAAALVIDVPQDGYRLFAGGRDAGARLASRESRWLAEAVMPLALAHVDPRDAEAAGAVEGLAAETGRVSGGRPDGRGRGRSASGGRTPPGA